MRANRRSRLRIAVRLTCTLQFYVGVTRYGHTLNLSSEGALVECDLPTAPGIPEARIGDLAVFSLSFQGKRGIDTLRIPCRIAHLAGCVLGLELLPGALSRLQHAQFLDLLCVGQT